MSVSLNVDLGENMAEAPELFELADVVSVACGGHAGDVVSMRLACLRARGAKVKLGAHPSFPDRARFGREHLDLPFPELRASLRAQLWGLREIAHSTGLVVRHVKPHGALYHSANRSADLARLLVNTAIDALGHVTFVGPPEGHLHEVVDAAGYPFLREGFADRVYRPDGLLVPREEIGALLTNPDDAAAQARRLAASGRFDTLCVHSDTPLSVAIARAVRGVLGPRA